MSRQSRITDDGARKLAAAVLGLAHEDYKNAKIKQAEDALNLKQEAASAKYFLHTDWCRDLCDMIDVDYEKFVEVTIQKSRLTGPVYKYLEAEIRDYHRSKGEIEQIRRDIAESNHKETNKGGKATSIGNPTELKGIKLATDEKLDRLTRIVAAITVVLEGLATDRQEAIKLKYWGRLYTDEGIAEKVGIDVRTLYRWKKDFVFRVAIKLGYL